MIGCELVYFVLPGPGLICVFPVIFCFPIFPLCRRTRERERGRRVKKLSLIYPLSTFTAGHFIPHLFPIEQVQRTAENGIYRSHHQAQQ